MLDTDVAIETPEHIVFRYRIAGPMRRCLASVIDLLACYGAFFGIANPLFIFRDDRRCLHDLIAGTKVVKALAP